MRHAYLHGTKEQASPTSENDVKSIYDNKEGTNSIVIIHIPIMHCDRGNKRENESWKKLTDVLYGLVTKMPNKFVGYKVSLAIHMFN